MDYQNYSTTEPTHLFDQEPVAYGGFWSRFAAYLIDTIILWVLQYVIALVLPYYVAAVASLVAGWLYFALQESGSAQATVGKKALELKVTGTKGEPITFGQATGRYFGKFISAIILLIGFFMMIWDDRKQTLHDKMADTLVVKADQNKL